MTSPPASESPTGDRTPSRRGASGSPRLGRLAWPVPTLATVAVIAVPDFLPWYGYQEWLLQGLRQLNDTAARTIPAGSAVTTVAVPANGGCGNELGPSIGVPSLKWFDVERLLRAGPLRWCGDRGRHM